MTIKTIFRKILSLFDEDNLIEKSIKNENQEIIYRYNLMKKNIPSFNEPNYELAEKVFQEFNSFNLKNIEDIHISYLQYIPKSLLPYPKNYIKCAYYIYLELAKKNEKLKIFNQIREIGSMLFLYYPDYNQYQENLKKKKQTDKIFEDIKPRELFKKKYGVYQVSEEDYYSSLSSVDATNEELLHDFGFLPEIEEDINLNELWEKTEI